MLPQWATKRRTDSGRGAAMLSSISVMTEITALTGAAVKEGTLSQIRRRQWRGRSAPTLRFKGYLVLAQDGDAHVFLAGPRAHRRQPCARAGVLRPGQNGRIQFAGGRHAPLQQVLALREALGFLAVGGNQAPLHAESDHLHDDGVASLHDLRQPQAVFPAFALGRSFAASVDQG